MNVKIKKIEQLVQEVAAIRGKNKKIVHCHGVFDLLHIGHIRYLEQARGMGDVLIVTITPDRFVDKGPHRPAFTELLRAEAIASLACVDYVAINQWPTAEETLRLLRPDFYVKGSEFKEISSDMTGKIAREERVVKEIGATLAFTDDIVFSSSSLINRYISNFPDEIQKYLDIFRQRYTIEQIHQVIDKMARLKVLVIGDAIVDEYQFCEPIGISSKDPALALKYQAHDIFAGGVLAVANHIANFANKVQLVTVLGERDSQEEFIKSQLYDNISSFYAYQPNAPTLIKRRFIEGYSLNKLFEVYVMDGGYLPPEKEAKVCEWLSEQLPSYDLVVAADFGHGAISPNMINMLVEKSSFLAVNTQANAGNRGFHTLTRYPRADYVCIAEHEIRLEMRDVKGKIRPMMDALAEKVGCSQFVVTRGRNGCCVRGKSGEFVVVPSFAQKIVDRVGAGDAFLSVTALASALGVADEILGFIGNVVGSLAVEILGNKKSIDKLSVKKYITSLLK
jgi:rfaE bifunctional protein nucleotidyltransferase chain/domain